MESKVKAYVMTLYWGKEQTQGSKVTEVKQDIGESKQGVRSQAGKSITQ